MIVIVHSNVIDVAAAVIVAVVADCVTNCALNRPQPHTLVGVHGISYVVCMPHPSGSLYRRAVVLGVLASKLAYLQRWGVSHR